jgi:hypothetical protein
VAGREGRRRVVESILHYGRSMLLSIRVCIAHAQTTLTGITLVHSVQQLHTEYCHEHGVRSKLRLATQIMSACGKRAPIDSMSPAMPMLSNDRLHEIVPTLPYQDENHEICSTFCS